MMKKIDKKLMKNLNKIKFVMITKNLFQNNNLMRIVKVLNSFLKINNNYSLNSLILTILNK